jgi:hypothetical protein
MDEYKQCYKNYIIYNELLNYNLQFNRSNVQIYGEHHSNYDYNNFVNYFKQLTKDNPHQKYVVVLELSNNVLERLKHGCITSIDSTHSLSYLFARAINNNEFINLHNITFIFGDNRCDMFHDMLYKLEDNIYGYPNSKFEYINPENKTLLDYHTIISCWNNEKKLFENDKHNIILIDTYLLNIKKFYDNNKTLYFKDMIPLLDYFGLFG